MLFTNLHWEKENPQKEYGKEEDQKELKPKYNSYKW